MRTVKGNCREVSLSGVKCQRQEEEVSPWAGLRGEVIDQLG